MGCKYTIQAWGQHWKDVGLRDQSYSYQQIWQGQSLWRALWALYRARRQARRKGWGCVVLECR
jgi:hypothetical protein